MLSAFKLERDRLTRIELEDNNDKLNTSVWVDLIEPDDSERERVQSELGQSLATRPELEDIEASARFFEDEDGLHIHSFFFLKMLKTTLATPPWRLPSAKIACTHCASVSCRRSACTACARAISS